MCTFENLLSRLQQAKIKSKLRTEDISAISGIPVGTLSKIFAGITKDPKIGTLIAIVLIYTPHVMRLFSTFVSNKLVTIKQTQ